MRIVPGKARTFTLGDLCEWSGASAPQVEHWVRQEIIVPHQDSSGRGSPRVCSLQNVIEAAMARELSADHLSSAGGLSVNQLQALFARHRETLTALLPELLASATIDRYVETVHKLVALTGPGPQYVSWSKDVASVIR